MDKAEYIDRIKKELGFLPEDERSRAAEYFNSYFAGAESADEVISCLGSAENAAKGYYKNMYYSEKKEKFRIPGKLAAVLTIFVMPAAFGLAAVAACIAVGLISAAMIFLAAILIISVLMWFDGMHIIVNSFGMHIILADKLIQFGLGFLMFGVGLVLTWLIIRWYSKIFPYILRFLSDKCGKLLKKLGH